MLFSPFARSNDGGENEKANKPIIRGIDEEVIRSNEVRRKE